MLVLGIDPGTRLTGYAAVAREGGRFVCRALGVFRTRKEGPLPERLLMLHDRLDDLVAELRPDVMVVEDCFYARNLRATLKLGHVKGLALVVAARRGVPVFEYAPRRIKQAVVGNGNATKEQVRFMVSRMVVFPEGTGVAFDEGKSLDASDALAVAICHYHAAKVPSLSEVVSRS